MREVLLNLVLMNKKDSVENVKMERYVRSKKKTK